MKAPRTHGHDAVRSFPVVDGDGRPVADPDGVLTPGLTVAPTQPRRGLMLVRVLGEVDMLTAPRLRDVLDEDQVAALLAVAVDLHRAAGGRGATAAFCAWWAPYSGRKTSS